MYKVGSLYAGVGGVCSGFIQAGANVVWANEFDKNACITYRHNFKHTLYEEDVWKLDPNILEHIDILTGGFPCQPFSIAGYRKGFCDERGNHFFRIIDFIKALNYPKAIFLENVKNLYTHDKGKTFKIIKEALEANGYSFKAQVLNSKDYGNIPQNRERIYIVCFKNNLDGTNDYDKFFRFPSKLKLNSKIEDLLEINKNIDEKFFYREDKPFYNILKESMTNTKTVYQWRRHYVRENKSNVCPTLTANMGTGGHNVPLILTKKGIRKLTPKECFNFQGFPNTYSLPCISNSHLYKQAGNSVTVPVIERIAKNIIQALNKEKITYEKNDPIELDLF